MPGGNGSQSGIDPIRVSGEFTVIKRAGRWVTILAGAAAVLGAIGGASWWLAQRTVVTRDEYQVHVAAHAAHDAEVGAVLGSIKVTLDKQDTKLDSVLERQAQVRGILDSMTPGVGRNPR
jgi:hypothetical protein